MIEKCRYCKKAILPSRRSIHKCRKIPKRRVESGSLNGQRNSSWREKDTLGSKSLVYKVTVENKISEKKHSAFSYYQDFFDKRFYEYTRLDKPEVYQHYKNQLRVSPTKMVKKYRRSQNVKRKKGSFEDSFSSDEILKSQIRDQRNFNLQKIVKRDPITVQRINNLQPSDFTSSSQSSPLSPLMNQRSRFHEKREKKRVRPVTTKSRTRLPLRNREYHKKRQRPTTSNYSGSRKSMNYRKKKRRKRKKRVIDIKMIPKRAKELEASVRRTVVVPVAKTLKEHQAMTRDQNFMNVTSLEEIQTLPLLKQQEMLRKCSSSILGSGEGHAKLGRIQMEEEKRRRKKMEIKNARKRKKMFMKFVQKCKGIYTSETPFKFKEDGLSSSSSSSSARKIHKMRFLLLQTDPYPKILNHILLFVPVEEILKLQLVCCSWVYFLNSNPFWYILVMRDREIEETELKVLKRIKRISDHIETHQDASIFSKVHRNQKSDVDILFWKRQYFIFRPKDLKVDMQQLMEYKFFVYEKKLHTKEDEEILEYFRRFDHDRDGLISVEDLLIYFRQWKQDEKITKRQVQAIIVSNSMRGNRFLTYEEFKNILHHQDIVFEHMTV